MSNTGFKSKNKTWTKYYQYIYIKPLYKQPALEAENCCLYWGIAYRDIFLEQSIPNFVIRHGC